jgi:hypothetical protein
MPYDCDSLCSEIAPEVSEQLIRRVSFSPSPGVVGAMPISQDVIFAVVKGVTEAAAKSYGDTFANLVLTQKDLIKKVIGDASLAALDKVIHGLQGAN